MPRPRSTLRPLLLCLLAACGLPPSPIESDVVIQHGDAERAADAGPAEGQSMAEALASQPPLPETHGARSRARSSELESRLEQILRVVQPEVDRLQADLRAAVDALPRPERIASNDPLLRPWRATEREHFQKNVTFFYDEATRRLTELHDATIEAAAEQARTLATARGPMDAGATGDPALDASLETFDEVVEGIVGLNELSVHRSQDIERRLDLFEAFTSFGQPHQEGLGGRLMLFVGGDETEGVPRGLLAFRVDDGRDPKALHFEQALRHRIMRGNTVVKDMGWRLAPFAGAQGTPGHPATEILSNVLIAPHMEPSVDRSAPGYDKLRDMRVQCDGQSGVFEGDKLIGGVDWRVEFVITASGMLNWQLSGVRPVLDMGCKELMELRAGATPK
jgi:hypothetical protein